MSPEKAIQLVQRYAAANRRIKEQTHIIGIHLFIAKKEKVPS